MTEYDFLIIGGGIAGTSVAKELAEQHKVLLLERESQPGYHTTGRSAAIYLETYGSKQIRALTKASGAFFRASLDGESPLISDRGAMFVADEQSVEKLQAHYQEVKRLTENVQWLDHDELAERYPFLAEHWIAGVYEPDAMDIDVHGFHQQCISRLKRNGGELKTSASVSKIEFVQGKWQVYCGETCYRASHIINAAGAWADEIARLAGLAPLGLSPLKRSAVLIETQGSCLEGPYIGDIAESFYFKPDAGLLMVSPCDESPEPPCDTSPDVLEVAIAIDRFEKATELPVTRLQSKWAGQRTFSTDRNPVIGFDPRATNFFWLAGQGGYGIQTAPAIATLSRALLCQENVPESLSQLGVSSEALSPQRFLA
ncbi:FAD-dependent oxidoreductase [Pseudoalteromonas sp. OOF1S-7]|uniref:NAD(P)/FAD-dependent oxidoreductase n=1 Tax=Pseudoalteromonas sp. OOF1S-7 TaxID=2917757 RepID=UPI001EF593CA|nr:FAD-dependent oxidoreductase [Pseudoalteromonas sp. OOF1S-7]MCG7533911.1 FAD-binding oxidoreductase [Pseudoalteromonas sp. OOF1S-7]